MKRIIIRIQVLLILVAAMSCGRDVEPVFHAPSVARAGSAMVATQEDHATQIGLEVLKNGGNAAEAAIAIAFTIAVTYPQAGNLGGGGFLLYRDAEGGVFALDFRETAPVGLSREKLLDEEGRPLPGISLRGGLAIATPGTVAGLAEAHRLWATQPWKDLIAPAERLAREGYLLNERDAGLFVSTGDHLMSNAESRRVFSPRGRFPSAGERLMQPDLASTLQMIQKMGRDGFYRGPVARALVETVQIEGGVLTMDDLQNYRPILREPLLLTEGDQTIIAFPLPSSGGIAIGQILGISRGHRQGADVNTLHWLIEAERRAFADRSTYLGDPATLTISAEVLLGPAYLKQRASQIDSMHATRSETVRGGQFPVAEPSDTIHFSVVAPDGSAAALTTTLNGAFGTGITALGTGVLLNNEIDDFAVAAGVPNLYGLVGGEANAVRPGNRPLSSMTPMMVLDADGRLDLVLGSPGGSKIITSVLLTFIRRYDFGWSLEDAVAHPRWHHQWLPDVVQAEPGAFTAELLRELRHRGHHIEVSDSLFGNVTAVAREGGSWTGVADGRRGGSAMGF